MGAEASFGLAFAGGEVGTAKLSASTAQETDAMAKRLNNIIPRVCSQD